MRTSFRVALLVLCVALVAAIAWRSLEADTAPTEVAVATTPQAPPTRDIADIARPLPAEAPIAPAPEANRPLAPELAALLARAEAGDSRAACTLGTRLAACAYADFYTDERLDGLRQEEAKADASGDHNRADELARILLRGTEIRSLCDPAPASLLDRGFDFMRQAALAGESEAIVRYANGEALARRAMQPYAFLRTPRFDTWRSEALALVEALQQSGRPEAVLVMLIANDGGSHLSFITPIDPVQDAAYRLLAHHLFGEHEALRRFKAPAGLTPEQQHEAAQRAEAWHREQFSGKRFRLEEHVAALRSPIATEFPVGWPEPANSSPACFDGDAEGGP